MKRAIWKFPIIRDVVEMPSGAVIISCQAQDGVPTIWAIVDPSAEVVKRRFVVLTTGAEFTVGFVGGTKHLATLFFIGGIVGHVFEVLP